MPVDWGFEHISTEFSNAIAIVLNFIKCEAIVLGVFDSTFVFQIQFQMDANEMRPTDFTGNGYY